MKKNMKRMNIRTLTFVALVTSFPIPTFAQYDKNWSLQAGFGEINMVENKYNEGDQYIPEDKGNTFYLSADYWLSLRVALNGGLYLEQQGLITNYADGIGLKKVNMFGINAGAKYYFFPKKWVFQPHIGAYIYTNFLNLARTKGESKVAIEQGQPGSRGFLTYDVQCPALSLSPRIGIDIHLLSSLSLCFDFDYRIGLWGSNKAQLRFADGRMVGQTVGIEERNIRSSISIGLKMDFPVRPVSGKTMDNLFRLIYYWFNQ